MSPQSKKKNNQQPQDTHKSAAKQVQGKDGRKKRKSGKKIHPQSNGERCVPKLYPQRPSPDTRPRKDSSLKENLLRAPHCIPPASESLGKNRKIGKKKIVSKIGPRAAYRITSSSNTMRKSRDNRQEYKGNTRIPCTADTRLLGAERFKKKGLLGT